MANSHIATTLKDSKLCPECGHVFKGSGWDGIDAHWRSKHKSVMPYEEAWPLLQAGTYPSISQSEKFAQAAREHGASDDEEAFKGVLRKLAKPKL